MTLTFENDADNVKLNQHRSKIIQSGMDTQTHTASRLLYLYQY